jgi:signal transduction histidine kinase
MERIFDPFFTTRSDSVGLGLAIGYAICNRHGGTLELVGGMDPKGGTLFRMRLPALASTAAIPQIILPG